MQGQPSKKRVIIKEKYGEVLRKGTFFGERREGIDGRLAVLLGLEHSLTAARDHQLQLASRVYVCLVNVTFQGPQQPPYFFSG